METQQQKRDYEITVFLSPQQEMVFSRNNKTLEEVNEFVSSTKSRYPEARVTINQKKNFLNNNNGN
jgi:hypothetical protein